MHENPIKDNQFVILPYNNVITNILILYTAHRDNIRYLTLSKLTTYSDVASRDRVRIMSSGNPSNV